MIHNNKGIEVGSPWHALYYSSSKKCTHVLCLGGGVSRKTKEDDKVSVKDHQLALITINKIFILYQLRYDTDFGGSKRFGHGMKIHNSVI